MKDIKEFIKERKSYEEETYFWDMNYSKEDWENWKKENKDKIYKLVKYKDDNSERLYIKERDGEIKHMATYYFDREKQNLSTGDVELFEK